jgi:hypothetical protein
MAELRRRTAIVGYGLLTAQTEVGNIRDEDFSPFLYSRMSKPPQSVGIGEPRLIQKDPPTKSLPRPQTVSLSLDFLTASAGQYAAESPSTDKIQVVADGEGLSVYFGTGIKHRSLPLSSTEFFDDDAPAMRIEFGRDEKVQVVSLTFKGLWTTVAKKLV